MTSEKFLLVKYMIEYNADYIIRIDRDRDPYGREMISLSGQMVNNANIVAYEEGRWIIPSQALNLMLDATIIWKKHDQ